jgi:hypothetical protein
MLQRLTGRRELAPSYQGFAGLPDLGNGECTQFLCVEASNILDAAVNLAPGKEQNCGHFVLLAAVCKTAHFSARLIFSPRNMASIRSRRRDSSASFMNGSSVLPRVAILRVVEINCIGPRRPDACPAWIRPQRTVAGALPGSLYSGIRGPSMPAA